MDKDKKIVKLQKELSQADKDLAEATKIVKSSFLWKSFEAWAKVRNIDLAERKIFDWSIYWNCYQNGAIDYFSYLKERGLF